LIQAAWFRILADPSFLHRGNGAHVGLGVTTKRLTEPSPSPGEGW
jgi:hypothetical protein